MHRHAIELSQTTFCKTPERFDTVNTPLTLGKFILNQFVIAMLAIGMFERTKNDCFAIGSTTSFTANTLCAIVRFIDLYRALQRDSYSQHQAISVAL